MVKTTDEFRDLCLKLEQDFNDGKISKKELYQKGMQITLDKWEAMKMSDSRIALGSATCGCCSIAKYVNNDAIDRCSGCPIYETDPKYHECHNTPYEEIYESMLESVRNYRDGSHQSVRSYINGSVQYNLIKAEIEFLNEIFNNFDLNKI